MSAPIPPYSVKFLGRSYICRKHGVRHRVRRSIEAVVDEIDAQVDVREVPDFLQRGAHDERWHEVRDGERGLFFLHELPDSPLADFLADAVADKCVLHLDGIFSGELG
jgi:hypothetical protein